MWQYLDNKTWISTCVNVSTRPLEIQSFPQIFSNEICFGAYPEYQKQTLWFELSVFFFCALLRVSASMNNLYQSKTFSLFKSAIFSLFYTSSLGYYLCVNMSAIINEPWFQTIIEWCWRFELIAKKSKRVLS